MIGSMLATYHNHTTFSDGKDTPEQLVDAALRLGVDELGISDHFVLRLDGAQPSWGMQVADLPGYFDRLHTLRESVQKRGPLKLLFGLEVDWFPGHGDVLRDALEQHPLDYIIGSVHFVNGFSVDGSAAGWENLSHEQRNGAHYEYWRRMTTLAQSGLFDIVAHMDLPKKFGYMPTVDLDDEINGALDAIATQKNLVVELNTAGWHKPCADAYPAESIVRACHRRNIPMTISADAHRGDDLLRDFDRAAQRLSAAGYSLVARFENRRMRMEPLVQAVPKV